MAFQSKRQTGQSASPATRRRPIAPADTRSGSLHGDTVPKISVFLTSYNHSKYLRGAIDSVLHQIFQDFELIIWDDASTDDSWNIITSYTDHRIRAVRSESNTASFGCIPLINDLTGDFIAIHHSDDIWEPDKLSEQVSFLNSNPDIAAVFTNVTPIGETGENFDDKNHFYFNIFHQPNRPRHSWLNRFFYYGNCLCHPSVLLRRKALEECGGYRHGLYQLRDFDLWVRLCLKYEIYILPKNLTRFRIREGESNASGNKATTRIRSRFEFFKILENYRKIDDIDELFAIFPKAREYHSDKGFNIQFLLAMVAINDGPEAAKLFGLNLLFELFNKSDSANAIKAIYDFESVKFLQVMAAYDIFSGETLAQLEEGLVERNRALAERNDDVARLNQELAERNSDVLRLNQALAERNGDVARLNQGLAERDSDILRLNQALAERNDDVARLNQGLAERESDVLRLNQALVERNEDLASLNRTIRDLRSSRSWRLTRPLRLFGGLLRGERKTEHEGLRNQGGE